MSLPGLNSSPDAVPYCGAPPLPETLWSTWNFDPLLLVAAAALAGAFMLVRRRHAGAASDKAFIGAQVLLFIAFVTPLCALASALFSARVVHHIVLISFAAPLLALAFPARRQPSTGSLSTFTIAHAVFVWAWHLPVPYTFALSSDAAYWLMEVTLLGSAVLLWRGILYPLRSSTPSGHGPAFTALLGTTMQMGMLGAVLTFANRPLFVEHLSTTQPFGLSPLADQQLAGLIMWVPGALPYLIVGALLVPSLLPAQFLRSDTPR